MTYVSAYYRLRFGRLEHVFRALAEPAVLLVA